MTAEGCKPQTIKMVKFGKLGSSPKMVKLRYFFESSNISNIFKWFFSTAVFFICLRESWVCTKNLGFCFTPKILGLNFLPLALIYSSFASWFQSQFSALWPFCSPARVFFFANYRNAICELQAGARANVQRLKCPACKVVNVETARAGTWRTVFVCELKLEIVQ